MKIKTLTRDPSTHTKATTTAAPILHRNLDPAEHPFARQREYKRALNAVKVQRMLAKPFVGALSGHIDGVYSLAKNPNHISVVASGDGEGEIRVWNLQSHEASFATRAHSGFVNGLSFVPFGTEKSTRLVTCGQDKTIKIWDISNATHSGQRHGSARHSSTIDDDADAVDGTDVCVASFSHRFGLNALDHHRTRRMFATGSTTLDVWDHDRASPVQTFEWNCDTIKAVCYNPSEASVLASCGSDRTVTLWDMRSGKGLGKAILAMSSNAVRFNPQEPMNFAVANEDHNVYLFDMRNLSRASNILKDHVSAVMDVDFAPTGRELVTGSYDRTVRIFDTRAGHSRDMYHTKRMQRVFRVLYSLDARYVLSGSDDGNLRIWKAQSHEKLGPVSHRERAHIEYSSALVERFKHMPEIRRIDRSRNAPKVIKNAQNIKRVMLDSRKAKDHNRRRHAAEGSVPFRKQREDVVQAVE